MSEYRQLPLMEEITVHCFFHPCPHIVRSTDPEEAHALMEKHYTAKHTQQIERITGVKQKRERQG